MTAHAVETSESLSIRPFAGRPPRGAGGYSALRRPHPDWRQERLPATGAGLPPDAIDVDRGGTGQFHRLEIAVVAYGRSGSAYFPDRRGSTRTACAIISACPEATDLYPNVSTAHPVHHRQLAAGAGAGRLGLDARVALASALLVPDPRSGCGGRDATDQSPERGDSRLARAERVRGRPPAQCAAHSAGAARDARAGAREVHRASHHRVLRPRQPQSYRGVGAGRARIYRRLHACRAGSARGRRRACRSKRVPDEPT